MEKTGSITYKDYNERLRLPEQARDEEFIMKRKHYALCYAPGKGKTYPAIHCILEINKLKNNNAKVLILSDATCIKDMWKKEILPQNILPEHTTLCTDRTAIGKMKDEILSTKWDVLLVDECQSLRSGVTRAKTQFAKLVYAVSRKTEYVIGMTGTIAGNNDIEPFCVLHNLNIANLGEINCHAFKARYCVQELQYGPFGSFQKPVRLNNGGKKMMDAAFSLGCSFWDYDENDNMPPMEIKIEKFTVPLTQNYTEALDGILKCDEHESTVMKSIALQKAQQALNGFLYYDNEETKRNTFVIKDCINPKLEYVVNESKKDNQIIAYRFAEDEKQICEALDNAGIKHCSDISDFKNKLANKEHCVLVLQCSKGKSANLQECQNIIYYTSDFSFICYKQMIHRCWRRNQTQPCKVTFLVNDPQDDAKVEEKIWYSLRKKQNIHDLLMSIKNKEEII